MDEQKPVTCVMTYRGVNGFPKGIYEGTKRDVLVTGNIISPESEGGFNTVPVDVARRVYQEGKPMVGDFMQRIDEVIVYFGARGSIASLEAVEALPEPVQQNIKMVACDCGYQMKKQKARDLGASITWSECGGDRTLGRIVENLLR